MTWHGFKAGICRDLQGSCKSTTIDSNKQSSHKFQKRSENMGDESKKVRREFLVSKIHSHTYISNNNEINNSQNNRYTNKKKDDKVAIPNKLP